MGLVATVTSKAEPGSDSKEENEVYSKILREELIESLKEILTHFELRTNELRDLKEKYVDLMKQQESTLLDLKASEEGLRGFDFICKTYEDKLKFLCQKLQEKCTGMKGRKTQEGGVELCFKIIFFSFQNSEPE